MRISKRKSSDTVQHSSARSCGENRTWSLSTGKNILSSAELPTNEGSAIQSAAIGEVQDRRTLAKRRLQEGGLDDDKSACRATNRTVSRPRAPPLQPQISAHAMRTVFGTLDEPEPSPAVPSPLYPPSQLRGMMSAGERVNLFTGKKIEFSWNRDTFSLNCFTGLVTGAPMASPGASARTAAASPGEAASPRSASLPRTGE